MIRLIVVAAASIIASPLPADMTPDADRFIRNDLHLTSYRSAAVDLDHDAVPEILVYAHAPRDCGSGGCDLYILTWTAGRYRLVTKVGVARLPIRVLPSASHGWRDLGVQVAGGGITQGYEARLAFDGRKYPENPTVPPAGRMPTAAGRIVLPLSSGNR